MITYLSVQHALTDIVSETGEGFTPEGFCRYVDTDDQPLCIVGVYLNKYCNIPAQYFRGLASGSSGLTKNEKNFRSLKGELRDDFGLEWDSVAVDYLNQAQHYQDEGKTWGEAIYMAKRNTDKDLVQTT
jgi:hypothetical protein